MVDTLRPGYHRGMPTKRLAAGNLSTLRHTGGGRATLWWDAQCPGLAVSVTANGTRSWVYRERKRNPRTFRIGSWPDMTLSAARRKADELRNEGTAVDAGTATVAEVVERYLKEHRTKIRRIPAGDDEGCRRACGWIVEKFGRQRLVAVTSEAIAAAFVELHDRPGWHDRVKGVLVGVFRFAGLRDHPVRIRRRSQPYVKRGLEQQEIAALLREVKAYRGVHMRALLLTTFYLAGRPGELARTKWCDVDLTRKTLTVRRSKNGKDLVYDLPAPVVELLRELWDHRRQDEHVFEGQGGRKPLTQWDHAWHRIRDAAGLPRVRLYDACRHGRATLWLAQGVSLADISALLHHSDVSMTAKYLDSTHERRKAALAMPLPGDED